MQTTKKIPIIVATVNNEQNQAQIPQNFTGYQLKQYIYQNITQSLHPGEMKIYYAGIQVANDKKISSYKLVQGSVLKIIQMKISLQQIPGLIVAYQEDPISCQDITARMPCGHVIGRDCMTQFIRSLVESNQTRILCPSYKPDGDRCQLEWDFAMCRKIGVFTAEENNFFETGLSKNWILQNTVECPYCKLNLFKGDLKINRVKCPQCKSPDFCLICSKKWNSKSMDICGNQGCEILKEFLEASPWNKVFKLVGTDKKVLEYKLPQHRACPSCFTLIQHTQGCKHMDCNQCKKSFCWVCLSIKQNGKWKCGSFNQYCGKVQQVQQINT